MCNCGARKGWKASQEFGDGFGRAGEDQLGPEVGERLQDETPGGEPGVGEGEFGALERAIPGVKEVEVEGAGGVVAVFGGAALGAFDLLERKQEDDGFARLFDLHDRVEIRSRAGCAINGLGFVNRRKERRIAAGVEFCQSGLSGPQVRKPVAKVGAESDAAAHGAYLSPNTSCMS